MIISKMLQKDELSSRTSMSHMEVVDPADEAVKDIERSAMKKMKLSEMINVFGVDEAVSRILSGDISNDPINSRD